MCQVLQKISVLFNILKTALNVHKLLKRSVLKVCAIGLFVVMVKGTTVLF